MINNLIRENKTRIVGVLCETEQSKNNLIHQLFTEINQKKDVSKIQILKLSIALEDEETIFDNLLFYHLTVAKITQMQIVFSHLDFQRKIKTLNDVDNLLVMLLCGITSEISYLDFEIIKLKKEEIRILQEYIQLLNEVVTTIFVFINCDSLIGSYFETLYVYKKSLIPLKFIELKE